MFIFLAGSTGYIYLGSLLHVLDFPSTLVGGHGIQKNHSESKPLKKLNLPFVDGNRFFTFRMLEHLHTIRIQFLQNSVVKLKKDADLSGPGFCSS